MERLVIDKFTNNISTNSSLSFYKIDKSFNDVLILQDGSFDVLFNDLYENQIINIRVGKNCNTNISFLAINELKNLTINIDIERDSFAKIYFADFSLGNNTIKASINLNGDGADCFWKLASLTSQNDDKYFDISLFHNSKNTNGKVDNYGVCKDNGSVVFAGTSYIKNGCVQSKTFQNSKIMVFDESSKAIAKPILKIDENEIQASHAAVVGKVNDEHLFYLTSRGLSLSQAKQIITYGYLKPILEGFIEDDIKEKILKLIEERM